MTCLEILKITSCDDFQFFRMMSEEPTDVHLNPLKVLLTLEDVMSDDSIIVADGGDFVGTAAYILR